MPNTFERAGAVEICRMSLKARYAGLSGQQTSNLVVEEVRDTCDEVPGTLSTPLRRAGQCVSYPHTQDVDAPAKELRRAAGFKPYQRSQVFPG